MTHPMHLVCPNSPSVWDRNQLSECFDDMVLGFGVNVVTIIIISIFVITKRGRRRSKVDFIEKVSSKLLPVFGLCLSLLSLMFLVDKALKRNDIPYHEWYFICSRFAVWMFIILYSRCTYGHFIFCNWLVGGWWLARSVVGGLHLLRTIFSSEVLISLNESSLVLLDIMFGIIINITWIKLASCKTRSSSSIEDPLLPVDINIEESQAVNSGPGLSCWDSVAFDSISSVMNRGMTKQLEFEDLLEMPSEMDPPSCHDILLSCWKAQQSNNPSNPSLLRAICGAYGWPYFRLGFLKIFNDCICFAGPLLLNKLIQFLQQGSGGLDGYILAGSLGITSILKSFLDTQYSFRLSKLKLKLRSGIMTTIYQKCLCVSLAERSQFSEGEIQTFMSVDADRTVNMCNSFHDIWSLPLQIGVAFYLLYTQVKFAFISGVALTILLIPVNKWIATLIANATGKMMKQKDERIRRTGELLTHIRTLKMYGWELLFSSWLMETRSSEVKSLSTRKYLDAWCVFFWATTPTLFSLFTFGLYTMMGHQLDAATVFTCLALFNSLISPLNSFPWVINGLIDAIISSRRLSRFLSCSEQKRNLGSTSKSPITFAKTNQASYEDMAVVMHEACCAWSDSNENRHVLNHVTLSLPRGSFITVVGEVGSGKSSLLNALLGEMHVAHGLVYSSGSLAYVPQVPWIQSGTVRDNILFGKSYDVKRYSDTLKACALDVDISLMNGGDMAYIGDKGINLSGGQRARLALARAVYCSCIFCPSLVPSALLASPSYIEYLPCGVWRFCIYV